MQTHIVQTRKISSGIEPRKKYMFMDEIGLFTLSQTHISTSPEMYSFSQHGRRNNNKKAPLPPTTASHKPKERRKSHTQTTSSSLRQSEWQNHVSFSLAVTHHVSSLQCDGQYLSLSSSPFSLICLSGNQYRKKEESRTLITRLVIRESEEDTPMRGRK